MQIYLLLFNLTYTSLFNLIFNINVKLTKYTILLYYLNDGVENDLSAAPERGSRKEVVRGRIVNPRERRVQRNM